MGIGFAIPSNQAKTVVPQLRERPRVAELAGRGDPAPDAGAGQGIQPGRAKGALVRSVTDDSPADKAGIKAGDIITEYDGRRVGTSADLPKLVAATAVGRQAPVTVVREGKTVALNVTIAADG